MSKRVSDLHIRSLTSNYAVDRLYICPTTSLSTVVGSRLKETKVALSSFRSGSMATSDRTRRPGG